MSDPALRVGIVGYGLLGAAFVHRLSTIEPSVLVYDRSATQRDAAAQAGCRVAESVGALASTCDTILIVVYSPKQVEDVVREISAVTPPTGEATPALFCSTTLAPDDAEEIAAIANSSGWAFVEFPISGTSVQVREGAGFGLLSGPDDILHGRRPVIDALTFSSTCFDRVGDAARAKLAINLVLEVNRSALAEGLLFAETLGLEMGRFADALRKSAAYSRVMEGKMDKLLSEEFSPEGRCEQSLKDVRTMIAEAKARDHLLRFAAVQETLLADCVARGEGDLDSSAVLLSMRRASAGTSS